MDRSLERANAEKNYRPTKENFAVIAKYKKSRKNEPTGDHRDNEQFYRFMQEKGRQKNSEKPHRKGFFDLRGKPATQSEGSPQEETDQDAYTNQEALQPSSSESQIDKFIESYHNSMPDYYTFESFNSSNTQMQDRSHNINSPQNPKPKPKGKGKPEVRKHQNFSKSKIPQENTSAEPQEVDYSVTTNPVEDIDTEEVD